MTSSIPTTTHSLHVPGECYYCLHLYFIVAVSGCYAHGDFCMRGALYRQFTDKGCLLGLQCTSGKGSLLLVPRIWTLLVYMFPWVQSILCPSLYTHTVLCGGMALTCMYKLTVSPPLSSCCSKGLISCPSWGCRGVSSSQAVTLNALLLGGDTVQVSVAAAET